MSTGDIRNQPYATRAREYVWSTLCDVFPRGISPTDIDGLVEINSCFLIFEGKTAGKLLDKGQQLAHKRHLLGLPVGKAVAVVGEHPALDKVDVATGLSQLRFAWRNGLTIRWSSWLPGATEWNESTLRTIVGQCFVRDAAAGTLHPEKWEAEWLASGDPFEESA